MGFRGSSWTPGGNAPKSRKPAVDNLHYNYKKHVTLYTGPPRAKWGPGTYGGVVLQVAAIKDFDENDN